MVEGPNASSGTPSDARGRGLPGRMQTRQAFRVKTARKIALSCMSGGDLDGRRSGLLLTHFGQPPNASRLSRVSHLRSWVRSRSVRSLISRNRARNYDRAPCLNRVGDAFDIAEKILPYCRKYGRDDD